MPTARVGADGPPRSQSRTRCPLHTQHSQGVDNGTREPLQYGAAAGEPGTTPVTPGTALFVEVFAGAKARLTKAMQAMGILVAEPQDILSGGFDILDPKDVGRLCEQLRTWASLGYYIVLHIAVP